MAEKVHFAADQPKGRFQVDRYQDGEDGPLVVFVHAEQITTMNKDEDIGMRNKFAQVDVDITTEPPTITRAIAVTQDKDGANKQECPASPHRIAEVARFALEDFGVECPGVSELWHIVDRGEHILAGAS